MLCTPVSGCRSGVKCRGSVSNLRAAFGFDFFLSTWQICPAALISCIHILLGYYVVRVCVFMFLEIKIRHLDQLCCLRPPVLDLLTQCMG